MAASEIAGMIPADAIAEIKKTDPHPIFKAFVIGHEGEAEGNVVGVGNVVKRWYRSVIERLHDKIAVGIQNGLAVFHGHAATNENEGRVSIGRVVGKALKDIGGRLSTIVAVYLNPAHNRRNFDIASIEASVDMEMDKDGGWEVKDVSDVTGLALGSSQLETPGFAGATLLGQLQAFALKQNVSIGIESKPGIVLGYRLNSKQSAAPPAGGNGGSHA
ncbi:MAG: hypothetical protein WC583_02820 [Candidatus Omnitrophota bacterium]|jgi:hypothetical protein|nr:hypothetical protein [Sphaerochaeta sp.]